MTIFFKEGKGVISFDCSEGGLNGGGRLKEKGAGALERLWLRQSCLDFGKLTSQKPFSTLRFSSS